MVVNPIMLAIDTTDAPSALELASRTRDSVGAFKIGLGLLHGPARGLIGELNKLGRPVFADAKLHDIPTQVGRAARALGEAGARWITAHASGGAEMLEAAVAGLADGAETDAGVLGVSVLTSLNESSLRSVGINGHPVDLVAAMAAVIQKSGAEGIVCSPREIRVVRHVAPALAIVTPGIRPAGSDVGDQRRTSTPDEAISAGATWIVVGRPITAAPDPQASAAALASEVAESMPNSTAPA